MNLRIGLALALCLTAPSRADTPLDYESVGILDAFAQVCGGADADKAAAYKKQFRQASNCTASIAEAEQFEQKTRSSTDPQVREAYRHAFDHTVAQFKEATSEQRDEACARLLASTCEDGASARSDTPAGK